SLPAFAAPDPVAAEVAEQIEIETKYAGYLQRQRDEIVRQQRHEETAIPAGFDYAGVRGLSAEVRQKLERVRPGPLARPAAFRASRRPRCRCCWCTWSAAGAPAPPDGTAARGACARS